jgi:hypothetical protein
MPWTRWYCKSFNVGQSPRRLSFAIVWLHSLLSVIQLVLIELLSVINLTTVRLFERVLQSGMSFGNCVWPAESMASGALDPNLVVGSKLETLEAGQCISSS